MQTLVQDWFPPSRENWELICFYWQFFPLVTAVQWVTSFYPAGKTSITSRFNLPGKYAWAIMETPGMLVLIYCMMNIPAMAGLDGPRDLPWANWTMAGMYIVHYIYRALASPLLLNPTMSPIHPIVMMSAFAWNVTNALSLGGWLAGYGPTTKYDWAGRLYEIEVGLVLWGWSFLAVCFHDDDLREIRRSALRRQKTEVEKSGKPIEGVDKLYMLPKNGLFHWVLFPHYFCEWCEWAGFWMVGGLGCVPARTFLVNEVTTMLPRAVQGWHWYVEKFGREKVGSKKAVIPGLI